jgi:hypothetical protein
MYLKYFSLMELLLTKKFMRRKQPLFAGNKKDSTWTGSV